MDTAAQLASVIFRACQYTPFRGIGGYSSETFQRRGNHRPFPQAETEAARFDDFFSFFTIDVKSTIRGRDVLDFGCGYGGRTVGYAQCGARFVIGVEPFAHVIERASAYAAAKGVTNVEFRTCTQQTVPIRDASIDVVLSYDVLEHVDSPPQSVSEIHRVLRPGGIAFLAFPVYSGACSHHLDYICRLPGIHWVFSAKTLIRAVNPLLTDGRFGTAQQPEPRPSFDGKRYVLPQLNGLESRHLPDLFSAFRVLDMRRYGILKSKPFIGSAFTALARTLPATLSDAITLTVACVLEKRG